LYAFLFIYVVRVEIYDIILDYRIFKTVEEEGYSVFLDKGLLSPTFVPVSVVGRERAEEFFARILALGVRDGFPPNLLWIQSTCLSIISNLLLARLCSCVR